MGAPDSALPVFSFRPDWKNGVTEHLEWLTDVLTSKSAAEQRLSLRLSARRGFEVEVDPIDNERTFLDLFIRRFSNQEFMLPLWHDHGTLTAAAAIGASSLAVDTTDREFVAPGMALLMGADAFSCEAVQIDGVASGTLTLSAPTAGAWPTGATIHPLRRSWLIEQPKAAHETDRLDTVPMHFQLSGPADYDGGSEDLATYGGYPVLSPAPDWNGSLSLEYARDLAEVDGKTGVVSMGDPAGRSFAIQLHRWFLSGRPEHAAFRRLISRLRGKQGSLWLPSFTADLSVVAPAAIGDTHIDVKQCGLLYAGFPVAGRTHAITAAGQVVAFTGVTAPSAGVERIAMSALTGALTVGDSLSFADVGRLDTDTIDIHHQTDTDGVAQVEAPFRSFSDIRDGSGLSALPLATATMNADPCGTAPWTVRIRIPYTANSPSPPGGYALVQDAIVFAAPGSGSTIAGDTYAGGSPVILFDKTLGEVIIYFYMSVSSGYHFHIELSWGIGSLQAAGEHMGPLGGGTASMYVERNGGAETLLAGPESVTELFPNYFDGDMP